MLATLRSVFGDLMGRVRLHWTRFRFDLSLDRPAYVALTARFDFVSDGFRLGGKIVAGPGLRVSHGALLAPYGGRITLGKEVFVGPYAVLYGHGGLVIGDNVLIAGHTTLVAANHEFSNPAIPIVAQGHSAQGIRIGNDVWIGSGCRILDGVTIGDGAVIAAGAVVANSIEPYAVAAGVPAKVRGFRGDSAESGTQPTPSKSAGE